MLIVCYVYVWYLLFNQVVFVCQLLCDFVELQDIVIVCDIIVLYVVMCCLFMWGQFVVWLEGDEVVKCFDQDI